MLLRVSGATLFNRASRVGPLLLAQRAKGQHNSYGRQSNAKKRMQSKARGRRGARRVFSWTKQRDVSVTLKVLSRASVDRLIAC